MASCQQRLSKACENAADQIGTIHGITGEYDRVKAADLIYMYMRDLLHEFADEEVAMEAKNVKR